MVRKGNECKDEIVIVCVHILVHMRMHENTRISWKILGMGIGEQPILVEWKPFPLGGTFLIMYFWNIE